MKKLFFMSILMLLSTAAFGRDVEFSWAPMPSATKYEIQVSKSFKFEKIEAQAQTERPSYTATVNVGRYYYRVRVLDIKGRPGKWSAPGTVLIDPYAPELISPAGGYQTSYYEIPPDIDFSWKSAIPNMTYEVLVTKTTGEKVLEAPASELKYKTNKIEGGEYTWRVRAVTEDIKSEYSEPRRLTIIKKPFKTPVLIKPSKDGIVPAYREVSFQWEADPASRFDDLHFEKVESYNSDNALTSVDKKNLETGNYKDPYEEPGKFKWWVVTKEAKDTPGIKSEVQEFEVRNDVLARGNYELEFSLSPFSDLYTTSSARQTLGTSQISQQSTATGNFIGFLGGYYFWESLGIFMQERTSSMKVETFNDLVSETDFQLRIRFGSRGFNQEFHLGYRLMDLIEAENTPVSESTSVTAMGPLIGTRITATLSHVFKAQVQLFYFKPLSNIEGMGGWVNDVYGGFAGLKWNFMNQFWLGYRFQMERINSSFNTPLQAPVVTSQWTQYRLEPFYISISYEH